MDPHRPDSDTVCLATDVRHRYPDPGRAAGPWALQGIDLAVGRGEVVALLGPNGSGKTTLFRLLCTLLPLQQGVIRIGGCDVRTDPLGVRGRVGIVFQSPSLDGKLTVDENIAFQASLYGIDRATMTRRRDELLRRLGLSDRRAERCETLSGGLKRRAELAKGMLHRPPLLLLDEPSTGLDPTARQQLWEAVRGMADSGVAVVLTTHLLEEAEKSDRVVILANGRKIAEGPPAQLRRSLGGGFVTLTGENPSELARELSEELGLEAQSLRHQVRIHSDAPAALVPGLADRFGDRIETMTIGRPTLEDVFIAHTGHRFDEE